VPGRPEGGGRLLAAVFLALLGALAFLKMVQEVDNDLFWQIKDGERIVLQGHLPTVEEYSFTAPGKPMVAIEWGAAAACYLAFRLGGYCALVTFNTVLFVAAFALLLALLRRRLPLLESLCLVSLAAFAFLTHLAVRAQNWTFLFTALFLYWAALWEEGAQWVPWTMAGVLLAWVNLHGGFILGLAILALLCLRHAWLSRRPAALGPLGLGALCCCAHPNGVEGLLFPFWAIGASSPFFRLVHEFNPVDFADKTSSSFLLILVFLLWLGVEDKDRRFPWAWLTLALTVLSLRSRKFVPEFALAAAASLAFKGGRKATRAALCGAAVLALSVMGWVVLNRPWPSPFWDWEHNFPKAAVELIASRYPDRRIFNEYDWGGYLIYKLYPHDRVFIDGRFVPYLSLLPDAYMPMMAARPGWQRALDDYGITVALLRPMEPLCAELSRLPAWKTVYADGGSVLLVR
jgi:hypothetical protein